MRILLTNLFLQGYTGSESYVYTLGKELRNKGHEVVFYVHNWGWFGDQVRAEGFECWHNPNRPDYKLPHTNFDLVHFQHRETVARIYKQVKHIPKIFISHGMLPEPEQPLPYAEYPMDGYAGVSEETLENNLKKAGAPDGIPTAILRNLIDTSKYQSSTPINDTLKSAVIVSNYMGRTPQYIALIKEACARLNVQLTILGDAGQRVKDTRPFIEKSDMVIGIGRCVFEGMAMGRNVMVFDYQGLEGTIESEGRYLLFRKNNLSGRYRDKKDVSLDDVLQEFARYSKDHGDLNRKLIQWYHSAEAVTDNALDFYNRSVMIGLLRREGKNIEKMFHREVKQRNAPQEIDS